MSHPLVDIIIPTYNRKKLLKRAVLSIQNQSYKNWRLLIVDDGSTDGSIESLAKTVTKRSVPVSGSGPRNKSPDKLAQNLKNSPSPNFYEDKSAESGSDNRKKFLNENRITMIKLKQNRGVGYARNQGIKKQPGGLAGFFGF